MREDGHASCFLKDACVNEFRIETGRAGGVGDYEESGRRVVCAKAVEVCLTS
jgi:hypothetical protein